jgi:hypothetical protein
MFQLGYVSEVGCRHWKRGRQVTAALVALENAKTLWNGRAGIGFEILSGKFVFEERPQP